MFGPVDKFHLTIHLWPAVLFILKLLFFSLLTLITSAAISSASTVQQNDPSNIKQRTPSLLTQPIGAHNDEPLPVWLAASTDTAFAPPVVVLRQRD